mgnify:CR=1 FL=1|jgi:hypothetical protein|tara:strand:- start:117 stop:1139 length:1023 start_codon:yes stop_codon:yes gene_type:complete
MHHRILCSQFDQVEKEKTKRMQEKRERRERRERRLSGALDVPKANNPFAGAEGGAEEMGAALNPFSASERISTYEHEPTPAASPPPLKRKSSMQPLGVQPFEGQRSDRASVNGLASSSANGSPRASANGSPRSGSTRLDLLLTKPTSDTRWGVMPGRKDGQVMIHALNPEGYAKEVLCVGDIILAINNQAVATEAEVVEKLNKAHATATPTTGATVSLLRPKNARHVYERDGEAARPAPAPGSLDERLAKGRADLAAGVTTMKKKGSKKASGRKSSQVGTGMRIRQTRVPSRLPSITPPGGTHPAPTAHPASTRHHSAASPPRPLSAPGSVWSRGARRPV